MFNRKCPNCNCNLTYVSLKNRNVAEKHKVMCKICTLLYKKIETLKRTGKYNKRVVTDEQKNYILSQIKNPSEIERFFKEISQKKRDRLLEIKNTKEWVRNCPKCESIIKYSTRQLMNCGEKNKTICNKCRGENRSKKMLGENNHFFNKHHSDETKKKIKNSQNNSEKYKEFLNKVKGAEHKKMLSNLVSGEKNPRYGRGSLYDIWLEKFGEEEAKKRDAEYKTKCSIQMSGEKNNMYGKPSPSGSGNGWSGWYKNWFFRSIHELSYMINVIEKNNLKWESAEKRKYMIEYIDFKGHKRNYFSDFIIDENKMVEVKPERLKNSKSVIIKKEAAEIFCKNIGYTFELVTPQLLVESEIVELYLKGKIKFTDRYEQKFKKRFNI